MQYSKRECPKASRTMQQHSLSRSQHPDDAQHWWLFWLLLQTGKISELAPTALRNHCLHAATASSEFSFMQSQFDYSQPHTYNIHTAVLKLLRGPSGYLQQPSTTQKLGNYCVHFLHHNSNGNAEWDRSQHRTAGEHERNRTRHRGRQGEMSPSRSLSILNSDH